jgi:acyl-CoA thioester hydrolase
VNARSQGGTGGTGDSPERDGSPEPGHPRDSGPGGVTRPFRVAFPVRIGDINYGGHMGNDRILALFHDARLAFLGSLGFSEQDIGGGAALIMSEAHLRFRAEAFHGDTLAVLVSVSDLNDTRFTLEYTVLKDGSGTVVATGSTVLVGFDYEQRRVCRLPAEFRARIG